MPFELTPEQRQAVIAGAGAPFHIHDAETQKVYLVVEQGAEPTLDEEYVQQGLELARQQMEQGDVAERDMDAVIVESRRRYASAG